MSAGKLENTRSHASGGSGAWTTGAVPWGGTPPGSGQVHASTYGLPCERSDAASAVTVNWGWRSSSCKKRWPTAPVAPRIPTRIFSIDPRAPLACAVLDAAGRARYVSTYNRSGRGDCPRRGIARAFLFPERDRDASERDRAGGRLDCQSGRRVRLRGGGRRTLAPRHGPGGARRDREAGDARRNRAQWNAQHPRDGAGGGPAVS